MLSIPGLRPDKILKLYYQLRISTLEELEDACLQDKLKGVKGLGPALQRKILAGMQARKNSLSARHVHRAADLLQLARSNLRKSDLGLRHIEIAGDLRRGCALVTDLSLVAE